MNVALVCSAGGHLTELQFLSESFEGHDTFFVTYHDVRTEELEDAYLLEPIDTNPWRLLQAFYRIGRIFRAEQPDVVVSTGSEIAIPAFVWAALLDIESVYIESWCRVNSLSGTGRLVYHLADLFLVQWPQLREKAGERARYEGAVI